MIDKTKLIPGECYFFLYYLDRDLRIPEIKTLVFSEKITDDGEVKKDLWIFQDPQSFFLPHGSSQRSHSNRRMIHRFDEDTLFSIYDLDGLIHELSINRASQ